MYRGVLTLVLVTLAAGCGGDPRPKQAVPTTIVAPSAASERTPYYGPAIDLPQVDQKPGTAVVMLVDTSGSMKTLVSDGVGGSRSKSEMASKVMNQVIEETERYLQENPVVHLEFGIFSFSSSVNECLKIAKFDRSGANEGVDCVPQPNGGTAIGRALINGFQALYSTGCVRKYLVCITDGENTSGPSPERVAKQLFGQTEGDVEIHFIAFDISSSKFRFLDGVNGYVEEASDGEQLSQKLKEIYEKRILAEAPAEVDNGE